MDLAAGGFDAGIRLGQFIAPDMVVVRLTRPFPFMVVGSPEYLAHHGRPERLDDLRRHACLRLRRSNGAIAPWSFIDGNRTIAAIVSGPLIAHDYPTLLGAAMQGVGLALVPGPIAKAPIADGRLQALLTPFAVTTPGVFLYHPGKRQVLPKLRAFIEHIKTQNADAPRDETNYAGTKQAQRFEQRLMACGKRGAEWRSSEPTVTIGYVCLRILPSDTRGRVILLCTAPPSHPIFVPTPSTPLQTK